MLSPTGDYVFGNGSQDFFYNVPAAVGQVVETGLRLWLGEWFLDNTAGMPWVQGVLGKQTQEVQDATIQNQVVNTQGVSDISSYQSVANSEGRSLKVTMKIDTIYGPTQVQIDNFRLY